MTKFTGYPLSTTYVDATTAAGVHAPAHNSERAALNSVQDQIGPVRYRAAKNSGVYPTGDQGLLYNSTLETQGGITYTAGIFTVPTAGFYSWSWRVHNAAGLSSAQISGFRTDFAGIGVRIPMYAGSSSVLWMGGSYSAYLTAGQTVSVSVNNSSGGSLTLNSHFEINRVSPA